MEQSEARLARDFPYHNWLFNKYQASIGSTSPPPAKIGTDDVQSSKISDPSRSSTINSNASPPPRVGSDASLPSKTLSKKGSEPLPLCTKGSDTTKSSTLVSAAGSLPTATNDTQYPESSATRNSKEDSARGNNGSPIKRKKSSSHEKRSQSKSPGKSPPLSASPSQSSTLSSAAAVASAPSAMTMAGIKGQPAITGQQSHNPSSDIGQSNSRDQSDSEASRNRGDHSNSEACRNRRDHSNSEAFRNKGDQSNSEAYRNRGDHSSSEACRNRGDHSNSEACRNRGDHSNSEAYRNRGDHSNTEAYRNRGDHSNSEAYRNRGDHSSSEVYRNKGDQSNSETSRHLPVIKDGPTDNSMLQTAMQTRVVQTGVNIDQNRCDLYSNSSQEAGNYDIEAIKHVSGVNNDSLPDLRQLRSEAIKYVGRVNNDNLSDLRLQNKDNFTGFEFKHSEPPAYTSAQNFHRTSIRTLDSVRLPDRTISGSLSSDRTSTERISAYSTLSDRTLDSGRFPDRTISSDRISAYRTLSDRRMSDRTLSDRTSSNRIASDRTVLDRRLSDGTISDRTVSDRISAYRTVSDRTISNRVSSDATLNNYSIRSGILSNFFRENVADVVPGENHNVQGNQIVNTDAVNYNRSVSLENDDPSYRISRCTTVPCAMETTDTNSSLDLSMPSRRRWDCRTKSAGIPTGPGLNSSKLTAESSLILGNGQRRMVVARDSRYPRFSANTRDSRNMANANSSDVRNMATSTARYSIPTGSSNMANSSDMRNMAMSTGSRITAYPTSTGSRNIANYSDVRNIAKSTAMAYSIPTESRNVPKLLNTLDMANSERVQLRIISKSPDSGTMAYATPNDSSRNVPKLLNTLDMANSEHGQHDQGVVDYSMDIANSEHEKHGHHDQGVVDYSMDVVKSELKQHGQADQGLVVDDEMDMSNSEHKQHGKHGQPDQDLVVDYSMDMNNSEHEKRGQADQGVVVDLSVDMANSEHGKCGKTDQGVVVDYSMDIANSEHKQHDQGLVVDYEMDELDEEDNKLQIDESFSDDGSQSPTDDLLLLSPRSPMDIDMMSQPMVDSSPSVARIETPTPTQPIVQASPSSSSTASLTSTTASETSPIVSQTSTIASSTSTMASPATSAAASTAIPISQTLVIASQTSTLVSRSSTIASETSTMASMATSAAASTAIPSAVQLTTASSQIASQASTVVSTATITPSTAVASAIKSTTVVTPGLGTSSSTGMNTNRVISVSTEQSASSVTSSGMTTTRVSSMSTGQSAGSSSSSGISTNRVSSVSTGQTTSSINSSGMASTIQTASSDSTMATTALPITTEHSAGSEVAIKASLISTVSSGSMSTAASPITTVHSACGSESSSRISTTSSSTSLTASSMSSSQRKVPSLCIASSLFPLRSSLGNHLATENKKKHESVAMTTVPSSSSVSTSVSNTVSTLASSMNSIATGVTSIATGMTPIATSVTSIATGMTSIATSMNSIATGMTPIATGLTSIATGMTAMTVSDALTIIATATNVTPSHSTNTTSVHEASVPTNVTSQRRQSITSVSVDNTTDNAKPRCSNTTSVLKSDTAACISVTSVVTTTIVSNIATSSLVSSVANGNSLTTVSVSDASKTATMASPSSVNSLTVVSEDAISVSAATSKDSPVIDTSTTAKGSSTHNFSSSSVTTPTAAVGTSRHFQVVTSTVASDMCVATKAVVTVANSTPVTVSTASAQSTSAQSHCHGGGNLAEEYSGEVIHCNEPQGEKEPKDCMASWTDDKNIPLDLCVVKSETAGISFRQRSNPPVQMVHPRVHKPAGITMVTGAVSSAIETAVAVQSIAPPKNHVSISDDASQYMGNLYAPPLVTPAAQSVHNHGKSAVATKSQLPSNELPSNKLHGNKPGGNSSSTTMYRGQLHSNPASYGTGSMTTATGVGLVVPIQPMQQHNLLGSSLSNNSTQLRPSNPPSSHSHSMISNHSQIDAQMNSSETATVAICSRQSPGQGAPNIPAVTNGNVSAVANGNQTPKSKEPCRKLPPLLVLSSDLRNQSRVSSDFVNQSKVPSELVNQSQVSSASDNGGTVTSVCTEKDIQTQLTLSIPGQQVSVGPQSCQTLQNSEALNSSSRSSTTGQGVKIEGKDSKGTAAGDLNGDSNDDEDDDIKRQMDELDEEIRRKEREQEEMRRRKLELLEKRKQAKATLKTASCGSKETGIQDVCDKGLGNCSEANDVSISNMCETKPLVMNVEDFKETASDLKESAIMSIDTSITTNDTAMCAFEDTPKYIQDLKPVNKDYKNNENQDNSSSESVDFIETEPLKNMNREESDDTVAFDNTGTHGCDTNVVNSSEMTIPVKDLDDKQLQQENSSGVANSVTDSVKSNEREEDMEDSTNQESNTGEVQRDSVTEATEDNDDSEDDFAMDLVMDLSSMKAESCESSNNITVSTENSNSNVPVSVTEKAGDTTANNSVHNSNTSLGTVNSANDSNISLATANLAKDLNTLQGQETSKTAEITVDVCSVDKDDIAVRGNSVKPLRETGIEYVQDVGAVISFADDDMGDYQDDIDETLDLSMKQLVNGTSDNCTPDTFSTEISILENSNSELVPPTSDTSITVSLNSGLLKPTVDSQSTSETSTNAHILEPDTSVIAQQGTGEVSVDETSEKISENLSKKSDTKSGTSDSNGSNTDLTITGSKPTPTASVASDPDNKSTLAAVPSTSTVSQASTTGSLDLSMPKVATFASTFANFVDLSRKGQVEEIGHKNKGGVTKGKALANFQTMPSTGSDGQHNQNTGRKENERRGNSDAVIDLTTENVHTSDLPDAKKTGEPPANRQEILRLEVDSDDLEVTEEMRNSYRNKSLQELQNEAIRQIQIKESAMLDPGQLASPEKQPSSLEKPPVLMPVSAMHSNQIPNVASATMPSNQIPNATIATMPSNQIPNAASTTMLSNHIPNAASATMPSNQIPNAPNAAILSNQILKVPTAMHVEMNIELQLVPIKRQRLSTQSAQKQKRTRSIDQAPECEIEPAHSKPPPLKKLKKGAKPEEAHVKKINTIEIINKITQNLCEMEVPLAIQQSGPYFRRESQEGKPDDDNKVTSDMLKPRPAHIQHPFGIQGHLIVKRGKKAKRRTNSLDRLVNSPPKLYSLPNTPTTSVASFIRPRAYSVCEDFASNGDGSCSQVPVLPNEGMLSPTGNQRLQQLPQAQIGIPVSPIHASYISQASPTSGNLATIHNNQPPMLAPPTQPSNIQPNAANNHLLDLSKDLTAQGQKALVGCELVCLDTDKDTERVVQLELNQAIAKRQRMDDGYIARSGSRSTGNLSIPPHHALNEGQIISGEQIIRTVPPHNTQLRMLHDFVVEQGQNPHDVGHQSAGRFREIRPKVNQAQTKQSMGKDMVPKQRNTRAALNKQRYKNVYNRQYRAGDDSRVDQRRVQQVNPGHLVPMEGSHPHLVTAPAESLPERRGDWAAMQQQQITVHGRSEADWNPQLVPVQDVVTDGRRLRAVPIPRLADGASSQQSSHAQNWTPPQATVESRPPDHWVQTHGNWAPPAQQRPMADRIGNVGHVGQHRQNEDMVHWYPPPQTQRQIHGNVPALAGGTSASIQISDQQPVAMDRHLQHVQQMQGTDRPMAIEQQIQGQVSPSYNSNFPRHAALVQRHTKPDQSRLQTAHASQNASEVHQLLAQGHPSSQVMQTSMSSAVSPTIVRGPHPRTGGQSIPILSPEQQMQMQQIRAQHIQHQMLQARNQPAGSQQGTRATAQHQMTSRPQQMMPYNQATALVPGRHAFKPAAAQQTTLPTGPRHPQSSTIMTTQHPQPHIQLPYQQTAPTAIQSHNPTSQYPGGLIKGGNHNAHLQQTAMRVPGPVHSYNRNNQQTVSPAIHMSPGINVSPGHHHNTGIQQHPTGVQPHTTGLLEQSPGIHYPPGVSGMQQSPIPNHHLPHMTLAPNQTHLNKLQQQPYSHPGHIQPYSQDERLPSHGTLQDQSVPNHHGQSAPNHHGQSAPNHQSAANQLVLNAANQLVLNTANHQMMPTMRAQTPTSVMVLSPHQAQNMAVSPNIHSIPRLQQPISLTFVSKNHSMNVSNKSHQRVEVATKGQAIRPANSQKQYPGHQNHRMPIQPSDARNADTFVMNPRQPMLVAQMPLAPFPTQSETIQEADDTLVIDLQDKEVIDAAAAADPAMNDVTHFQGQQTLNEGQSVAGQGQSNEIQIDDQTHIPNGSQAHIPSQLHQAEGHITQGHLQQEQGQIMQEQLNQGQIIQGEGQVDNVQIIQVQSLAGQGATVHGQVSQRQPGQILQVVQGQSNQGQIIQGKTSQGQIIQVQPSQGQIVQGQVSQGQIIQGQASQGQMVQGQTSHSQIVRGQSQASQGQIVQRQASQGQVVQGQTSQGQEDEMAHMQQVLGKCALCGKSSIHLCSNCKRIWYCCEDCQLSHWDTHKSQCVEPKLGP